MKKLCLLVLLVVHAMTISACKARNDPDVYVIVTQIALNKELGTKIPLYLMVEFPDEVTLTWNEKICKETRYGHLGTIECETFYNDGSLINVYQYQGFNLVLLKDLKNIQFIKEEN